MSKIIWVSDCEYYLTRIPDSNMTHDAIDTFFESTPIRTAIVKVAPSYYIFRSRIDSSGKSLILIDTMKRLR
jgi:hypothetical protein